MEWPRSKWCFENCFTVDSVGRGGGLAFFFLANGGGLALMWMNDAKVNILSYSNNHIDAKIVHTDRNVWRFIGFYGHPNANLRD